MFGSNGFKNSFSRLFDAFAGNEITVLNRTFFVGISSFSGKAIPENIGNRDIKMTCKGKITVITRRYRHDGTCAIAGEYIFRDPYGDLPAAKRMDGISPGKTTGDLFLCHTLSLGAAFYILDILRYFCFLVCSSYFRNQLQLWCQHHKVYPEYGVGARSEYFYILFFIFDAEAKTGSFTAADPVALHFFHGLAPL